MGLYLGSRFCSKCLRVYLQKENTSASVPKMILNIKSFEGELLGEPLSETIHPVQEP